MRWAAMLLGTDLDDATIMSRLDGSNLVQTYKNTKLSSPNENYQRGATDVNKLFVQGPGKKKGGKRSKKDVPFVSFIGGLLYQGTAQDQDAAPIIAQLLCADAERVVMVTDEQGHVKEPSRRNGYTVSIHYEYKLTKRTSGHSVGFYYREAPERAQFFDPNYGAWLFQTFDQATEFFADEWLPRFLAGSLKMDPGDETNQGKARKLTYFKIHQVEIV
jgi:hypothetical protein